MDVDSYQNPDDESRVDLRNILLKVVDLNSGCQPEMFSLKSVAVKAARQIVSFYEGL
jgi:hypothetical protein